MEKQLLKELFERMVKEGFEEGTEQYEICKRAAQFLNFSYKRSEELDVEDSVDCSTLTSQSHWEGALIGIPFVADNQRKATSGKLVDSFADMVPADVLIKFPSLEASPDKTWNHVGLYLGMDAGGIQWLIESTSKTGVRLSTVEAFKSEGGIKRFTTENQKFNSPVALRAIDLARAVPKFGRLGVRQYRKSMMDRLVHRGLDIYMPAETPVYATIEGVASSFHSEAEDVDGIQIVGECLIIRYLMLRTHIIGSDIWVQEGDLLGYITSPSERSEIVYSLVKGNMAHLHLEVEVISSSNGSFAPDITTGGKCYLNHLYLSKAGRLPLPFDF